MEVRSQRHFSGRLGLGQRSLPLFSAVNSNNKVQPITSKPLLAPNPLGGVMVYFGTGSI